MPTPAEIQQEMQRRGLLAAQPEQPKKPKQDTLSLLDTVANTKPPEMVSESTRTAVPLPPEQTAVPDVISQGELTSTGSGLSERELSIISRLFGADENAKENAVNELVIGSTDEFLPSSTTSVVQYRGGYKTTAMDEVKSYVESVGGGVISGATGIDIPNVERNIGFTVGQMVGFFAPMGIAAKGLRFAGPLFARMSPLAQRVTQQMIIGGSVEGVRQGMRGLVGQQVHPWDIAKTAVLFGGAESALYGLGMFGRTVFKKSTQPLELPPSIDIKFGKSSLKLNGESINKLKKNPSLTIEQEGKRVYGQRWFNVKKLTAEAADPQFMEPLGVRATQTVKRWLSSGSHNVIKRGFFQARNLLKSPEGRELVKRGDLMLARAGIREGKMSELMSREIGLKKLSRDQRRLLSDILEHTDKNGAVNFGAFEEGVVTPELYTMARRVRMMLNDMADVAKASGINMGFIGKSVTGNNVPRMPVGYFPRVWNRKTASRVYDDIYEAMRQADALPTGDIGEGVTLTDRVLSNIAKKRIAEFKFSPLTERAIESIRSSGNMSRYDAIAMLERDATGQLFMPFGNLESHRVLQLPLDFYERDALHVLDRYIAGWARRVSEAEAFGPAGQEARKLIEKIATKNPVEAKDAQDVIQSLLRVTEITKRIENPFLRKMSHAYVNFRVGTAIGLGFATVPNLTQTLISTAAKHGPYRTFKGLAGLTQSETRKWVRQSGATWWDAHKMMFGMQAEGIGALFSRTTTELSLFNSVNTFNKALAASTAKQAIPEYYAKAQLSGHSAKIAQRRLAEMGIDHTKPLTDDVILSGMNKFANDSQLMANVLNEPLWFNNPKLRVFNLFKRFGYRQATFIKDHLAKEFTDNPLPMLRLVAGGYLGGRFVEPAREHLKWFLSGEEPIEPNREWLEETLNYMAASGAAGVFTDLIDVPFQTDTWKQELYGKLVFAFNPIIVDDVLSAAWPPTGVVPSAISSQDRKWFRAMSAKLVKEYGGSIGRYTLGYRLETREQTRRRRQGQRRRARR